MGIKRERHITQALPHRANSHNSKPTAKDTEELRAPPSCKLKQRGVGEREEVAPEAFYHMQKRVVEAAATLASDGETSSQALRRTASKSKLSYD
jgi:hypothetical protein